MGACWWVGERGYCSQKLEVDVPHDHAQVHLAARERQAVEALELDLRDRW